ncbi:MAG: TlpA disulfide reductase family protein [Cyclobacteriaceae bacterium]
MGKFIFLGAVLCVKLCFGQSAEIIKLADLQKLMEQKGQKILIINFWATWCAPCVKELPFFEKITAEARPDVQVTLVSLDLDLDPNPEKVYKFISRKNLQSKVVLLEESDPNSWISKIEKKWSGALPATILINHETGKRKFIEKALREGDLEQYLEELQ